MLTQATREAVIAGLSGILGGAISGIYQHFREWHHRPKLQITVAKMDGEPNIVAVDWTEGDQRIERFYARFSVQNIGRAAATNCRVFLVNVDEIIETGRSNRREIYESFQLPWTGGALESRILPSDLTIFVDLVFADTNSRGWQFSAKLPRAISDKLKEHKGTFLFGVVATADNAEASYATLAVTYWDDASHLRIDKEKKGFRR